MRVIFIRHGKTKGNLERKYIGATDEPLSSVGVEELSKKEYPWAERIITSPLKRCKQSAEIIYGSRQKEVCEALKECDFGDFENKSYNELKDNKDYIRWLESNGTRTMPNGENHSDFCNRCCECFKDIILNNKAKSIALVVHGGTIMAILERYSEKRSSFYDWQIKNGEYLVFQCYIYDGKIRLSKNQH